MPALLPQWSKRPTIRHVHALSSMCRPKAKLNLNCLKCSCRYEDTDQKSNPPLLFFFFLATPPCQVQLLVPQIGIKPVPSEMEAQSPNLWTTREIPDHVLLQRPIKGMSAQFLRFSKPGLHPLLYDTG